MQRIGVLIVVSILFSSSVLAQNNRSAVSLSGTDTATCTVPDPCRTFGVAISKTNVGGEVIVLSSGGYGAFTVNKSVSIVSPNAFHAALAPTSGDAVTVNVDNAVVVLRGLTLNGSLGGVNGITFTGADTSSNTRLYVENCVISGFSNYGVNFARNGTLFVSDATVRQSGNAGIFIDGSPSLPSRGTIDHALLEGNFNGLLIENAAVAVRDSVAAGSSAAGFLAPASAAGSIAELLADNCQATHNGNGFYAGGGAGTARMIVSNSVASANINFGITANVNATVRASNNTVTRNDAGFAQFAPGVFESRGNNTVRGNITTETSGTITTFGPM